MSDDEARVFTPINHLRAKIGTAPGPDLDQIIADAEAALGELKGEYEVWIRADISELQTALTTLRQMASPTPEALDRIQTISHEIKGQGTTFGYPLLTKVGHLLHRFIARDAEVAVQHLDLISAHVDFMSLVIAEGIHDDGDAQTQRTVAELQTVADKLHGD